MVLRRIFRLKRDEETGERRKLHNEELTDLHTSPKFIGVNKSRRMKWEGRVACFAESRIAHIAFVRKPEGHRPLEKLDVNGKVILKGNL